MNNHAPTPSSHNAPKAAPSAIRHTPTTARAYTARRTPRSGPQESATPGGSGHLTVSAVRDAIPVAFLTPGFPFGTTQRPLRADPSGPEEGLSGRTSRLPLHIASTRGRHMDTEHDDKGGAVGLPPAVVDCALYEDGRRLPGRVSLEKILERIDPKAGRFAWIGLYEPTAEQFQTVADAFGLHPLAVEDAVHAHQRPKLERYGDILFLVLKTIVYVDHEKITATSEIVDTGEIMVFAAPGSPSPSATAAHRLWTTCADGSRTTRSNWGADRRRSCTRSPTWSSTATSTSPTPSPETSTPWRTRSSPRPPGRRRPHLPAQTRTARIQARGRTAHLRPPTPQRGNHPADPSAGVRLLPRRRGPPSARQ